MRKKRPQIARLDQVRISREGEDAIIEFRDSTIATTHLRIGPQLNDMTDEEILLVFNRTIAAQIRHRDELGEHERHTPSFGLTRIELSPCACDSKNRTRSGALPAERRQVASDCRREILGASN